MKISKYKLMQLRLERNFTYRQLAEDINKYFNDIVVSPASLNRWETLDKCNVNASKLLKVAEYFGVEPDELMQKQNFNYKISDTNNLSNITDSARLLAIKRIVDATEDELEMIINYLDML